MKCFALGIAIIFYAIIGIKAKAETSSYNAIEEVLAPLLNPKLVFKFLRNAPLWKNATKSFTKFDFTKPAGAEYVKGHSLKSPKTFENKEQDRSKRGVAHLYNMVSCATGCNPLSYKGYGCYCGFLGSGYPVDGIDKCCKQHDWCYDAARCPMYLEYLVPYFWKCWYDTAFCAVDHGEFGGPGSCANKLCECDRALSECLKKYPCPSKPAFCKSSPLRFLQNIFMFFA